VVEKLQELGTTAGLREATWNGHRVRRGAATWAAEGGISAFHIPTLVRWRSDEYKVYIEYSQEEQISVSKRFQGAQARSR